MIITRKNIFLIGTVLLPLLASNNLKPMQKKEKTNSKKWSFVTATFNMCFSRSYLIHDFKKRYNHEKNFKNRVEILKKYIKDNNPGTICIQEDNKESIKTIKEVLGKEYHIKVFEGKEILVSCYKKKFFEVIKSEHVNFANYIKDLGKTTVLFDRIKHKGSGRTLYFLNNPQILLNKKNKTSKEKIISALEKITKEKNIKPAFFNILFSKFYVKENYKYDHCRFVKRLGAMKKYINENNPDTLCIQEVHESFIPIIKKLFAKRYNISISDIFDIRGGKIFLTSLYKKKIFDIITSKSLGSKDLPKNTKINTVLCDKLKHKESNEDFYFFNTHFPLSFHGRWTSAKSMRKILEKFIEKKKFKTSKRFLMADFNAFPDNEGEKQMQHIVDTCSMKDVTKPKTLYFDGKEARHSFFPYPYDRLPKSAFDKNGVRKKGLLDRIFTANVKCKNTVVDDRTIGKILSKNNVKNKLYGIRPSDHCLLKTFVEFKNN
ncbi:hypothetical protein ACFLYU_01145 [Candidatus Dependentiae bacterium]